MTGLCDEIYTLPQAVITDVTRPYPHQTPPVSSDTAGCHSGRSRPRAVRIAHTSLCRPKSHIHACIFRPHVQISSESFIVLPASGAPSRSARHRPWGSQICPPGPSETAFRCLVPRLSPLVFAASRSVCLVSPVDRSFACRRRLVGSSRRMRRSRRRCRMPMAACGRVASRCRAARSELRGLAEVSAGES